MWDFVLFILFPYTHGPFIPRSAIFTSNLLHTCNAWQLLTSLLLAVQAGDKLFPSLVY